MVLSSWVDNCPLYTNWMDNNPILVLCVLIGYASALSRGIIDITQPPYNCDATGTKDVTVQLQVLAVLDDMINERGMGLIFISHDLNLIASFCDRILIMYGGQVMEECRADELSQAKHPYTRGLLNCLPRLDGSQDELAVLRRDPAWLEIREKIS